MTFPRLYLVVTPRPALNERELLARTRSALDGGVDFLQLRAPELEALPYLRLAEQFRDLASVAGVPFIVNDRPDVALAASAEGVHLGQHDLPVEHARRILPAAIIGRSSHELAHAARALAEGATYFSVGPVWETPTKPGRKAAGIAYVREVAARRTSIPWFAIGGITPDNVNEVIDAGATRIAIVRSVLDASDPADATHRLARALSSAPDETWREPAWS